jgi:hypothetical protein
LVCCAKKNLATLALSWLAREKNGSDKRNDKSESWSECSNKKVFFSKEKTWWRLPGNYLYVAVVKTFPWTTVAQALSKNAATSLFTQWLFASRSDK